MRIGVARGSSRNRTSTPRTFDNPAPGGILLPVCRIEGFPGDAAESDRCIRARARRLHPSNCRCLCPGTMLCEVDGEGRCTTTASAIPPSNFVSCTFAPAITMPRGLPVLSTSRRHVVPSGTVGAAVADRIRSHLDLAPSPSNRPQPVAANRHRRARRTADPGPSTGSRTPTLAHRLEMPMDSAIVREVFGQRVPLVAGSQPVEDPVHDRTQVHALVISDALGVLSAQRLRTDLAHAIRDLPTRGMRRSRAFTTSRAVNTSAHARIPCRHAPATGLPDLRTR
jgi:hypothetical protein